MKPWRIFAGLVFLAFWLASGPIVLLIVMSQAFRIAWLEWIDGGRFLWREIVLGREG